MSVDHLLSETDRQLGEQRARADAFATRSGLLTAASAVLTGILVGTHNVSAASVPALWAVGVAAVLGIIVLCVSRILLGPSPSLLVRWSTDASNDALLDSKVLAIESNLRALSRTEAIFFLQAVATIIAIVLLIVTR